MIEAEPSFGDRTVARLLGFNKNTVQRIFQLKGWQARKRAVGDAPAYRGRSFLRLRAERALIDGSGAGPGWHLSRPGRATTASAALEHAQIGRFGTLSRVERAAALGWAVTLFPAPQGADWNDVLRQSKGAAL